LQTSGYEGDRRGIHRFANGRHLMNYFLAVSLLFKHSDNSRDLAFRPFNSFENFLELRWALKGVR
jgi:hypothetical protein